VKSFYLLALICLKTLIKDKIQGKMAKLAESFLNDIFAAPAKEA